MGTLRSVKKGNMVELVEILPYTDRVITAIHLPELTKKQSGKVRENFDLDDGSRLVVTTDRMSAFDRQIAAIPFKGQVLTSIARFWFDEVADFLLGVDHHLIQCVDPNVMLVQKLDMLPVEIVVRDYLAGSTATSLATLYEQGMRTVCGVDLPDGLRLNQKLPETIITPTTKSDTHDESITPTEAIERGLLTGDEWDKVADYALKLFAFGQETAARRGLILADTKYEFGRHPDGYIMLADEIHTPDSSRFWFADTYEQRFEAEEAPDSFDKDILRRWIATRCNPYRDPLPTIPPDVIAETAVVYIDAYERLTDSTFTINHSDTDPQARIEQNVRYFLDQHPPEPE